MVALLKEAGLNIMFYQDWPDDHGDSETLVILIFLIIIYDINLLINIGKI